MDILIFSGQSNMEGQTGAPDPGSLQPGLFEYHLLTDSLVPLQNPTGEDIGELLEAADQGHGSLIPYLCGRYRELTGREPLAVHTAKGATRIDQWLPGTPLYDKMIEKIRGAMKHAENIERVYFFWLQGESDALAETPPELYRERMIELKNALKKDVGIQRFAIIEVGWFAYIYNPGSTYDRFIMDVQEELPRIDPDFTLVTDICLTLSRDTRYLNPHAAGHFNNEAMRLIGTAAAEGLVKSEK
ncbi:MAG: sialate O-acetylesterase [Ruminococcaceae bacterium]|nr:sialate O-acetylesterase [Oscillospiraceae bacterium]